MLTVRKFKHNCNGEIKRWSETVNLDRPETCAFEISVLQGLLVAMVVLKKVASPELVLTVFPVRSWFSPSYNRRTSEQVRKLLKNAGLYKLSSSSTKQDLRALLKLI